MNYEVKIEVDSRDVDKALGLLDVNTRDSSMRNLLKARVWPYIQGRIAARFANEGDEASGKWAELAYNTGRIRAMQGFPATHPINVRTGALKDFALNSYRISGSAASGATLTAPGDLRGKILTEKVRRAQSGSPATSQKAAAPARPVYALSNTDQEVIGVMAIDWIRAGFR